MKTKQINKYIEKCHRLAKQAGWWSEIPESEPKRSEWLADKIDLIASEGAEMIEATRENRYTEIGMTIENLNNSTNGLEVFRDHIKDTFEDELADIFIRTCDLMGFYGVELDMSLGVYNNNCTRKEIRFIRIEALELARGVISVNKHASDSLSYIIYRCINIAKNENIDLKEHVEMKLEYNKSRGIKHGKEF